jgi:signal transduction histidine kinase
VACLVAPIAAADRRYGALVIAPTGSAAAISGVLPVLTSCAAFLALRLRMEEQRCHDEIPRTELSRLARLAKVGELTNIMAHEFNNALNGVVLHLAVIGLDADEKLRGELNVIRDLANAAAGQIRKLQDYSRQQRPPLVPVDLNQAVNETVAWFRRLAQCPGDTPTTDLYFPEGIPRALSSGELMLETKLTPDLMPVLGAPAEVARLLRLLLAGVAAVGGPGRVTLGTEQASNKVILRADHSGSPVDPEMLEKAFDPFAGLQPGGTGPELALCRAIVRRFQGSAQLEAGPRGGLILSIEWQTASPAQAGRH